MGNGKRVQQSSPFKERRTDLQQVTYVGISSFDFPTEP